MPFDNKIFTAIYHDLKKICTKEPSLWLVFFWKEKDYLSSPVTMVESCIWFSLGSILNNCIAVWICVPFWHLSILYRGWTRGRKRWRFALIVGNRGLLNLQKKYNRTNYLHINIWLKNHSLSVKFAEFLFPLKKQNAPLASQYMAIIFLDLHRRFKINFCQIKF